MKTKTEISLARAVEIAQQHFVANDYNCESWDEVVDAAMQHADGIAEGLGIGDEYTVNTHID